ncbi:MAG: Uma2 family endonuclease, partial [Saprospiraceae bacterium]|nr:Uma2 family endonuclease [Saprospiraceae bacterium]
EELMGSSYLQSLIITKLVYFLMSNLSNHYLVLTNEIGLQFKDKGWRAADIAIIESKKLKDVAKTNKYLSIAPKIVIEIDTKAELEETKDSFGYFHKKTDELLAFGVEKVIWIFTDSEKTMISEKGKDWQILNWSKDIEIIDNLKINLKALIEFE